MQVSVETTGALERRMEVQVPAERIEKAIDERLQKLSRTVRLKGFRPGKVPVKVVRQQFGDQVRQEVLGDVLQKSFAEAVQQEKLTPAGGPKIEPLNVDQGGDLKYRAVFEIVSVVWTRSLGVDVEGGAVAKPADYSNTAELGRVLYTEYVYAFELAAVLLLIAIIAAISLTMRKRPNLKQQDVARQVAVRAEARIRIVKVEPARAAAVTPPPEKAP